MPTECCTRFSNQLGWGTRGTGLWMRCRAAGMVMIFWMVPDSRSL